MTDNAPFRAWQVMVVRSRGTEWSMRKHQLLEEELTRSVIGAFFTVYNALGYGFLEKLHAAALEQELRTRGHHVEREVLVDVIYEGRVIGVQRLDMVVDGKLIVEVKSTELLHPIARRQTFNYLKCTRFEIALLLHFGPQPKFYRLVNVNPDPA